MNTPIYDQLVAEHDKQLARRIGVSIYMERGMRDLEAYLDVHAIWGADDE